MATSVTSLLPHPSLSSSSFISSSFPSKRPLSFPSLKTKPPLPLKLLCSRDSRGPKKWVSADPVYRNRLVSLMVNRVLKNGKKSLAFYVMYHAMKRIRDKTGSNPLLVLRDAVKNVTPDVAVKARRVGGASVQVPVEVDAAQGKAIAIRWLLEAARKRQGQDMVVKLSSELLEAASGSGEAVRRKEAVHRMAESNRAFAHFR